MDFSGPVRSLLRQHLQVPSGDAFDFVAGLLVAPQGVGEVPAMGKWARREHELLELALLMRALPRVPRGVREGLAGLLGARMELYVAGNQRLLVSRSAPPVEQLWYYWLLVLSRARLKQATIDIHLKLLWKNAFSRQDASGALHAVGTDVSPDAATYNDLVALHLAYNAILFTRDFDLFPPVQKLADYLVENVHSNHTTNEPWGMAAFASLDQTRTYAAQQLHDATVQISTAPNAVIMGLFADALMAQEEAADA